MAGNWDRDRDSDWRGGGNAHGHGERGFFERAGQELRSWFGSDEGGGPRGREEPWGGGDWAGSSGTNYPRQASHPDDHYRSWRDRHIEQMDRDYEEYCRERTQSFHSDFTEWRQKRGASAVAAAMGDPSGLLIGSAGIADSPGAPVAEETGMADPAPGEPGSAGTRSRGRTAPQA
jgi:hypothetical protein